METMSLGPFSSKTYRKTIKNYTPKHLNNIIQKTHDQLNAKVKTSHIYPKRDDQQKIEYLHQKLSALNHEKRRKERKHIKSKKHKQLHRSQDAIANQYKNWQTKNYNLQTKEQKMNYYATLSLTQDKVGRKLSQIERKHLYQKTSKTGRSLSLQETKQLLKL